MNETAFLIRHAYFTTRQFAFVCDYPITSASRKLTKLARDEVIQKVTRGIWAQPEHNSFTPFGALNFLLGNERGYISFLSAMHTHGLISQIPGTVQIATTGHTRKLDTPIARYEFFRIKPEMMLSGIAFSETDPPYVIAIAEKALLDTLYISSRKGRRFASLPELDLSELDISQLKELCRNQAYSLQVREVIRKRLDRVF